MMNKVQIGKICLGFSLILILLMMLSTGLMAQDPQPIRVRPTVDPFGSSSPDEARAHISSGSGGALTSDNCAGLYGTAINWGIGGQPHINLILSGGGWGVQHVTENDGTYNFGALGIGMGVLQVEPGLTGLKPMVNNAAIRLTCDFVPQVNIGLYSGDKRPPLPGQITMRVSPQTVSPGEIARFDLTVTNSLSNSISQVVVTDLLPDGLTITGVNTSAGTAEVLDGKMLTVMVGDVPENGEVAISIFAEVGDDVPLGAQISNAATLFYAESAADQATRTLNVSSTGMASSANALASIGNLPQLGQIGLLGQIERPAPATDETAQAVMPDELPVTGLEVTLTFPLVILAVVGLFIKGIHSIQNRQRRQRGFRLDQNRSGS